MSAGNLLKTRTSTGTVLTGLLVASAVMLFIGSCTNEHKSLTGPLKGLAHIPAFSTSSATSNGATFTTDKDDYSPGEIVNLAGTGWQAGDALAIHLTVDPATHDPVDWSVTVDSAGNFTDASYTVSDLDADGTLTITATDSVTGESAMATFTDAPACPNLSAATSISSSLLAFTKATSGSTTTYSVATSNQSPSSGVPGVIMLCVYQDGTATSATPLYDSWTTGGPAATVEFDRPGGNPTNLPLDGSTVDVGSVTYSTLPTSETIVAHINWPAQCPGAVGGTCFKVLSEGGGGGGEADAPTISKDATGTYKNTYAWTIKKDVDKTTVKQIGGSATFNYTVKVSHDDGTISDVTVTGTITVSNPNTDNITADVTDVLSAAGSNCTVTGGSGATLTPGDNTFPYSCTLTGVPLTPPDNKATVTWLAQTVGTKSLSAGSADFTVSGITFTKNDIDECVSVTDSYAGTLGTACVGDANPKSFTYSRTIAVPQNDCQSYDNTATFTTNDTGATKSASQTVTVCGPAKTGALTIGFWKTTNGQGLIRTYCQNPALANYLKGLGAGSGPFSNAPTTTCNDLANYVLSILNGASATDMNKMLKAQMLGTALDVWFSGPGWTSTKIGGTKPPSNFLSHNSLGGFNMDVTAVCPMVDNTTTGTATCLNNTPSTDAVASGALPNSPMTMQAILAFAATTPSPFNGSTSSSVWYGGNRTQQEILKNVFDQFNNQLAFGSF